MKSIINIILLPIFLLYQLIVILRNYLYDINVFKATKLSCKIISVGNITLGGTGKTPTAIALANFLQEKNKSVAILSRGYGRKSKGIKLVTDGKTIPNNWEINGDEPTLMAKKLSNIPIVVAENRVLGGQYLVDNFKPDIIILDDGFQHRKLFRDIDVVLINNNHAKINNRLFGFANFREPWRSLNRAHLIILTKSNLTKPSQPLMKKINALGLPVYKSAIVSSTYLVNSTGEKFDLNQFIGKSALLFSGIGDPVSFEKTVQRLNFIILDTINFSDHKDYSSADLNIIESKFNKIGADIILTTEKDLLKISRTDLPIYAVPIATKIDAQAFKCINDLLENR